ncbi:MAG: hypothetical protein ACK5ZJ_10990 [Acidobacteriota bacterium]
MANQIDIPIELDLRKLLAIPPCNSIKLPAPKPLKLTLPSGGSLPALADISKGIPTDCAYSFNLMISLAPLLASMECLLKILKLLKPLTEVIKPLTSLSLPDPAVVIEFGKAVTEVMPCLLIPTPANILPFLRDLLCLILKFLKCFISQMQTIRGVMGGLTLQLDLARASGNLDLIKSIECAQENAQLQAEHFTKSMEPIGVILDLAGGLFEMAGLPKVSLPAWGSAQDLDAIDQILATLDETVNTLTTIVGTLGGSC